MPVEHVQQELERQRQMQREQRAEEKELSRGRQQQQRRGEMCSMRDGGEEQEVFTQRLLAGMHIGPDLTQEPAELKDPVTNKVTIRYPSRTWIAGPGGQPIVHSTEDLVAKFGEQKFAYTMSHEEAMSRAGKVARKQSKTPGDATADDMVNSPAVFPAGQVGTGHQGTSGETGSAKAGPAKPEALEKAQEEQEGKEEEEGSSEQQGQQQKPTQPSQSGPQISSIDKLLAKSGPPPKNEKEIRERLSRMPLQDLRQAAQDDEVDISQCKNKDEVVKALMEGS